MPAYERENDYPYDIARRCVQQAKEIVGAGKMMWGTDAPGLLTVATYHQLRDWVARHCDFFSPDDLKDVLGRTAQRVYLDGAP